MAAIDDYLKKISDPVLREKLTDEVNKLKKTKKFGLVFEEHIPECTPLYGIPVKKGATVAKKGGKISEVYRVLKLQGEIAVCSGDDNTVSEHNIEDLVVVSQLDQPIYPYLEAIDKVENDPDSELWHTIIEADNYHALQLLEYLYAGKVDCIYIDPPYNTGAKDWKYNNDYVDGADIYRHSKWLSMMKKRLELAKKMLNPADSVLIVTIDEKEYLHLGCLLEEMFPEARMQMVTDIINPKGTNRSNEFSRTNEFIFFVAIGNAQIIPSTNNMFETKEVSNEVDEPIDISSEWLGLRRRGHRNIREARPNQFYPIFISEATGEIQSIGDALPIETERNSIAIPEGCYAVFPLTPDGTEMIWGKRFDTARELLEKGYLKAENGKNARKVGIKYLTTGVVNDIESGKIVITGYGSHNEVVGYRTGSNKTFLPKAVWFMASHNADANGGILLKKTIGADRFTYPKSLYSVRDTIRFFVASKPNALIVDFFAGSGTTLHAVNLLNAEDDGHRRCIMVTNNEVSVDEAKSLTEQGYHPGDPEWEKYGIARYVTWPRTVCSIEGHDVNGQPLKGNYISDKELSMSDGFAANCEYFKLGFLDKNRVSLGMQFREILPLLWLKSGAKGVRPDFSDDEIPSMLILPKNGFAVLTDEAYYAAFSKELAKYPSINTVFFVTNSESAFREMSAGCNGKCTYQLYHDYLENFTIGARRANQ